MGSPSSIVVSAGALTLAVSGVVVGVSSPSLPGTVASAATLPGGEIVYSATGSRIAAVRSDGSGQRVLLTAPGRSPNRPQWSPTGKQIAFDGFTEIFEGAGHINIYTVNSDGTGLERQTQSPTDRTPAYSPDGTNVVFSSDVDTDEGYDLYLLGNGGVGEKVYESGGLYVEEPVYRPGHTSIAFVQGGAASGIYSTPGDGSGTATLLVPDGGVNYRAGYPDYTPDGEQLVFSFGNRIWIADADGTNALQIGSNPPDGKDYHDSSPSVSPDGTHVVFQRSWDPEGSAPFSELVLLSLADGTETVLVDHGDPRDPDWGPQTGEPNPTTTPTTTPTGTPTATPSTPAPTTPAPTTPAPTTPVPTTPVDLPDGVVKDLRVKAPKRQPVGRQVRLTVRVSSGEPTSIRATGTIRIGKAKGIPLKRLTRSVGTGAVPQLTLRPKKQAAHALVRDALKRNRPVKAVIRIVATAENGDRATKRLVIRLK